jgi:LysM repeat protein
MLGTVSVGHELLIPTSVTRAVSCYPAEGSADNPNWEQPWARARSRPLPPPSNDSAACFDYTVAAGDTVAGIVDHFGLNMQEVGRVAGQQECCIAVLHDCAAVWGASHVCATQ